MQDFYIIYQWKQSPAPVPAEALPYAFAASGAKKISYAGESFAVLGLSFTDGDLLPGPESGLHIAIIGEPLLRNDAAAQGMLPGSRLSAQHVLKLYELHGSDFTLKLKGNYAVVLLNEKKNATAIYNSRYGMSPLYYTVHNGGLHIASSLFAMRKVCGCQHDAAGIIESVLFNYPLAEKTLLKGVSRLLPGERIEITDGRFSRAQYFSSAEMFGLPAYHPEEVVAIGHRAFANAMESASAGFSSLCASLTGGFDSRTILAFLGERAKQTRFYSFGVAGSRNIDIPLQISAKEHLDFVPVYLDASYEKEYPGFAREAILQSDCLRTLEAANYPYAFKRLSAHAPVVLTGICGSELLRPFQNLGLMVSPAWNELNVANMEDAVWARLKEQLLASSYLNSAVIQEGFQAVKEHVISSVWGRMQQLTAKQRFFSFVVSEALPRYFGGEIHSERAYAINRFPFLDDEFVEFVFRSPYSGVRANPVKPSANERFKSQYFYAKLIEIEQKHLLYYPTDHGYPMHYVMDRFPLLRIAVPFILHSRKKRKSNYQEFKPIEWAELFYRENSPGTYLHSDIVNQRAEQAFADGNWRTNRASFNRITSLSYWFNGG